MEMDSVDLLLQGMGMSMYSRGLSELQSPMTGMLTNDASLTACLSFRDRMDRGDLEGVCDDEDARLLELAGLAVALIGQGTGSPPAGFGGDGSGVG